MREVEEKLLIAELELLAMEGELLQMRLAAAMTIASEREGRRVVGGAFPEGACDAPLSPHLHAGE